MQGELWLGRLATEASVAYETSELLWRHFVSQLELRLREGATLDMGDLGLWSTALCEEVVVAIGGVPHLLPPRIYLSIQTSAESAEYTTERRTTLLDLVEALELATGIRPYNIEEWLRAIPRAFERQLSAGRTVQWASIGVFVPIEGGYELGLEPHFVEMLNRPFSMFAPVALSAGAARDIAEEYTSLEEALAVAPVRYVRTIIQSAPPEISQETSVEDVEPNSEETSVAPTLPVVAMQPTAEEEIVPTELASTEPSAEDIEDDAPREVADPLDEVPDAEGIDDTSRDTAVRSGNRWCMILLLIGLLIAMVVVLWLIFGRGSCTLPQRDGSVSADSSHTIVVMPRQVEVQVDSVDSIIPTSQPEQTSAPVGNIEPTSVAPAQTNPADKVSAVEHPKTVTPAPTPPPKIGREAQSEVITLEAGASLMRIAERKYGHQAFWVYIYEENRELLPDPTNPRVGLQLQLPAARKYGIDPEDNNSVSRALALQRSLIR